MALSHNGERSKLGSFKQLKDGRIRVTVAHGYDLSGNPRRVVGYAEDMNQAERVALELAAQLGRRPDLGRGLTLRRWWQAYGAGKGERLAKATYHRYKYDMDKTWLPAMGDTDISLISRQDVQTILITLPTKSRAHHALRSLSAVLTQAVRDGYLTENPIRSGGFELPGDVGVDLDALDPFGGDDPFKAIEGSQDVWSASTVLKALPLMRGVPLETCWLAMVGAGLRREEALALTWRDVRRIEIEGVMVTQIAVYKALTNRDGLKQTKTKKSVRIVAVVEPFGERLWELRDTNLDNAVVKVSVHNIHHRWHAMFEPVTSKHAKTKGRWKGRLVELPYVPLNRMRATHATYNQQAGVLDSMNAAQHGYSERVGYTNYQRGSNVDAALMAGNFLLVEGKRKEKQQKAANA